MHELTAADLRRSRLHLFWIQLLFTLVMASMWVAEFILTPDAPSGVVDRFPLGSLPYVLVGLQVTAMVLMAAVWFAPVWTLVWMAPVAWLLPFGASEVPTAWRVLSLACVLALAWLWFRARRSGPDGPSRRPPFEGAFEESWAFQPALPGLLAIAASIVLAGGLLVAHQVMLGQARDFEERAETTLAEVISYDDEHTDMVIRVGDEEMMLEEPDWWEQPAVGDLVPVLVDPDDPEHVVFLVALDDPSWSVGLAAVAPLAGMWWGLPVILRARRSRELAARGAPGTLVRLASSSDGTFQLLPTDASIPLRHVINFAGLVPGKDVVDAMEGRDGESDDDEDDVEYDESGSLPESDAKLALWADEVKDMWQAMDDDDETVAPPFSDIPEDEKAMVEADFGPDVRDGEPFVLLGSWGHGSTVALLRASGQGWMAEIREPRFQGGGRPSVPWGRSAARGTPRGGDRAVQHATVTSNETATTRGRFDGAKHAVVTWTRRRTRWLRWVVALGVAAVGAFLLPLVVWSSFEDGFDAFQLISLGLFVLTAVSAPTIAVMATCSMGTGRSRRGLVSYGLFVDEFIAPNRLVSVIPGRDALALRLRDPEDALVVLAEDVGDDLESYGAAREVERWFSSAPADGRSARFPTPNLVATVVMVLVSVVASIVLLA